MWLVQFNSRKLVDRSQPVVMLFNGAGYHVSCTGTPNTAPHRLINVCGGFRNEGISFRRDSTYCCKKATREGSGNGSTNGEKEFEPPTVVLAIKYLQSISIAHYALKIMFDD